MLPHCGAAHRNQAAAWRSGTPTRRTIDPHNTRRRGMDGVRPYPQLAIYQESTSLPGLLAASWEISEDNRGYLKCEGRQFHDDPSLRGRREVHVRTTCSSAQRTELERSRRSPSGRAHSRSSLLRMSRSRLLQPMSGGYADPPRSTRGSGEDYGRNRRHQASKSRLAVRSTVSSSVRGLHRLRNYRKKGARNPGLMYG